MILAFETNVNTGIVFFFEMLDKVLKQKKEEYKKFCIKTKKLSKTKLAFSII